MRKILIVPEALLAELPSSFLDRRELRVRSAAGVEEAVGTARVWRPELVVLGAALPEESAAELVTRLRSLPPERRPKLLALVDPAAPAREVGADARLELPQGEAELLARIGSLLGTPVRRASRLSVEILARLRRRSAPAGAPGSLLANVVELSETGALLECESFLEEREELSLELTLPGGPHLALESRVVHAHRQDMRYALEFAEPESADRQSILVFIELQKAAREQLTRHTPLA